jgi:hypothetical protein
MLKIKSKKIMSLTLCSLMAVSIFSTVIAEAHPLNAPVFFETEQRAAYRHEHRMERERMEHERERRIEYARHHDSSARSEGEVITARIVGAVVGAIIAKNT